MLYSNEKIQSVLDNDDVQECFSLRDELINNIKEAEANDKLRLLSIFYILECNLIPWLPTKEFENLLQDNLLELLAVDNVDFKKRLDLRLMPFPEDSRDFVKIDFLKIFLKNRELIGRKTISWWLKNYEGFLNYKQGTSLDKKKFLEKNSDAKILSDKDKDTLIKVLDIFDYIKPEFDYKNDIINQKVYDMPLAQSSAEIQTNTINDNPVINLEKISLSVALEKYPEIGEQLITNNRITLKSFPEPVRPSIKNWLSDYTFTMGFDPHDSAARGMYLFQNKNTHGLSRYEQQRLGHILKAFDTEELIEINPALKQVVFPKIEIAPKPKTKPGQSANSFVTKVTSTFSGKPTFASAPKKSVSFPTPSSSATHSGMFTINKQAPATAENLTEKRLPSAPDDMFLSAGKIQFTSPQKMPFEKKPEQTTTQKSVAEPALPKSEPLKIIPRNFYQSSRTNNTPNKNVVNLKEE